VRLDVRHRLKPPSSPANLLAHHAWKLGLGVVVVVLLTARGAGPVYTHPHGLSTSVVATTVQCGDIKLDQGSTDTATWTATSSPYGTGSPYILPHNDPNLLTTDPNNPNCLTNTNAPDEVHVPAGIKLVIDGSQGPVQIFSHGTGIYVNGGQLKTVSTDSTDTVIFDAEPDVASWDGINVSAADAANRGNASLSFVSIQHALTAITITSGATSSPDSPSYGLTVRNSGIGPSYFNGIDATNTPILVTGRVDPLTLRPDGQFGTLNNIGSRGIKVMYDPGLANYPSVIPDKALDVENMTFGSSVPFGETTCVPLQPCAAGSIGNDAILGNFVTGQPPIKLDNNSFFRAGNYGLELTNANNPTITNNIFTCNGSGSPKPVISCVGTELHYPAIYLSGVTNLKFGAAGINNNSGQQNGLDAIGLNGQVVSDLTWQTPTNDANAPSLLHPPHALGYVIANGDLQLVNSKLTVKDGDVVKVKGGAILITNGSLDASSPSLKTFTSLRDNTVGLQACPSVLVQSCPSPLPANEWIGINLVGSTGNIVNANILFPTKAIDISGGQASLSGPDGGAYGLVVSNSRLGPTFSDSVAVNATPVYIGTSKFCRIDTIPSDAAYLQCAGAGPGDHGINASYPGTPRPAAGGGLKLLGNDFQGSTNEAILGTALGGRLVDIENNTVETARTYGMHLVAADNLTLKKNGVTGSGTGNLANATTYPAIYLDGISKADFSGPISDNTGAGNGLDAIAFHGSTADLKPLNWKTIGAGGGALGYLIDGDLAVNGDLTLAANDYAPVLGGAITMHNGTFTATGATLSSLKEQAPHLPSCGSVFVPKVSGVCPVTAPGDWTGLILDPGQANTLTDSEIRYAVTGISVGTPTGLRLAQNLTMTRSNVRNTAADGVATQSPLSITDGAFTGNAGRGIKVDLTGVSPAAAQHLVINGHTSIGGSGQDGIQAIKLGGHTVQITGASVDRAGAFGINLREADHLTLTNNTVTNGAPTYPAIYLNGFTGPFGTSLSPFIFGNKGAGNGIDAIAFHGTVTDNLAWQTARKTADPTQLLGYVLDNTLNMQPGQMLTVAAGDIVKVGNGGMLNLQGVTLRADGTESSGQKIFTSLTDNSAGVVACPSVLLPGCQSAAPGDWAGISLSGNTANGSVVHASVRYATTAISIINGATSTNGSSSFGLVVSRSTLASTKTDGLFSSGTAISVTDSTISGGVHGANVTLTNSPTTSVALRLSGNRFTSQSAEAILGQGLLGQPVWITDNRVQNAGTFGIRLVGSDGLVLRNNNISGGGGGPSAGAAGYPAIYLNGISADFTRNVRGNVGSANGLDVIAFHGTANGDLSWQTPSVNTTTAALGYVLDGSLTVSHGTLTVHPGDVVKSLGGPIMVSGGSLDASNTSDPRTKLFTSLKDQTAFAQTCPSILTGLCASGPQQGDWGGIVITDDSSGQPGSASVANGQINFAATALSIDSGPTASFGTSNLGLIVKGTTISDATSDGINAQDTPISVTTTTIQRVGVHGILATFFGGTPCVSACGTSLDVEHVTITKSAKDGIVASGLGGRHTVVSDNVISGAGTYGIRLAGADQLTLNNNTVNSSGGPATTFRYPAIYLSGVKADFELALGTTTVAGNHGSGNGLDAMVIHGEASQALTWLTTGVGAPVIVPPVPVDHFGYILDGGLTVDGALTTNVGDIVKVLGGLIQVNGSLQATGTTFTSFKDATVSIKVCDTGYDSVFIQKVSGSCPAAASGDWAGIKANAASMLTNTTIGFDDGLTVTGGTLQFAGGAMHDIAGNAIVVSGSPLSVTNVVFSKIGQDVIDSTNSGSTDTVTDDQFDHVGGVAINLQNAQADLERNVFTNDASPAVKTSGAPVTLQCSSIQSGGVAGDAGLVVKENDFVATIGVTAPAGASAENNWWGQTTGPSGQLSGGLTVTSYFTAQNPSATIAITGKPSATQTLDPVKSDHSLGTGLVQATLTFSRNMNPESALPAVSYTSSPVALTGAWKLNDPRTWIGTAPIDSSLAATGTHTVSANGAHDCVPDPLHNLMTPASNTFAADTTTLPAVAVNAPADLIGAHGARLHGRIDPNGWATGGTQSGQFVVTNLASPFDQHTYATPPLADKTTPQAFTLMITGLSPSSTYAYQLQVPGPNGTAVEPTADTVTTTALASKVVFTSSPPASIQAGTTFSATATTEDPSSNVVNDFAGTVSAALTAAGGATLSGTLTQPVVNGVANFGDLSVNKTGSYTLTATSSPVLTSAISSTFAVQPGAATKLAFTVQPPATPTAGATLTPATQVSIEDSLNNVVTGDIATQVTVALTNANGATLSGTTIQTAANGVASFANLSVDKIGSYTLTATSNPALTSAISSSFAIQLGPATQLAFTVQPSSTAHAGVAFTQQPVVSVEDAGGNVVTTDNATVVTLAPISGESTAILFCTTNPITVTNGIASFAACAIDKASLTAYQLSATSTMPTLGPVSSSDITVSP
jgi:parallel beta-helix repeat protein